MAKDDKNEITINDNEFVLQHPGVKEALDIDYRNRDRNGNINTPEFVQDLLDNVVIKPQNFKLDDFESLDEVRQFQEKVQKFL